MSHAPAPPRLRTWRVLLLLGLVALFGLSLLPLPASGLRHGDKFGHVLAYAVLMGYAVMLFRRPGERLLAALGLGLLGGLIEALQGLLPWRSAEVADLLANTTGLALGAALALTPLVDSLVWLERRFAPRT